MTSDTPAKSAAKLAAAKTHTNAKARCNAMTIRITAR